MALFWGTGCLWRAYCSSAAEHASLGLWEEEGPRSGTALLPRSYVGGSADQRTASLRHPQGSTVPCGTTWGSGVGEELKVRAVRGARVDCPEAGGGVEGLGGMRTLQG